MDNKNLTEDMVEHICNQKRAFFKSQQIDEDDLCPDEKRQIVRSLFADEPEKFFSRFGKFLMLEHVQLFADESHPFSGNEQLRLQIAGIQRSIQDRKHDIKNRRFVAMQRLIKKQVYFSEIAMMRREPSLYDQLIGKYMTEAEKKVRDYEATHNSSLLNIILDGIDRDQANSLRIEQETNEVYDGDATEIVHFQRPEASAVQTKHWGNFDDEDSNTDRSIFEPTPKLNRLQANKTLTANERSLLRDEFIGIMHSKFLSGSDVDFDYSGVDNNSDYDDHVTKSQDAEDKYFDEEEEEEEEAVHTEKIDERISSSEDELDVYMKHINQQPHVKSKKSVEVLINESF